MTIEDLNEATLAEVEQQRMSKAAAMEALPEADEVRGGRAMARTRV